MGLWSSVKSIAAPVTKVAESWFSGEIITKPLGIDDDIDKATGGAWGAPAKGIVSGGNVLSGERSGGEAFGDIVKGGAVVYGAGTAVNSAKGAFSGGDAKGIINTGSSVAQRVNSDANTKSQIRSNIAAPAQYYRTPNIEVAGEDNLTSYLMYGGIGLIVYLAIEKYR